MSLVTAAGGENFDVLTSNPWSLISVLWATIGLAHIGRALQRLTTEVASLRDDLKVLTAIVQRHEETLIRGLEQMTAMVAQNVWIFDRRRAHDERLGALEDQVPGGKADRRTRPGDACSPPAPFPRGIDRVPEAALRAARGTRAEDRETPSRFLASSPEKSTMRLPLKVGA